MNGGTSPPLVVTGETEDGWTDTVIDLCRFRQWRVIHFRPAQTNRGWRTPILGDKGWPDIFAVRAERAVAAELKIGRRKPEHDQQLWLTDLDRVAGIECYVFRPSDWLQVREVLW